MITVRFPNGQAVQYNDAHFVDWSYTTMARILTKEGGRIMALIPLPTNAIIEFTSPCCVYNPLTDTTNEQLRAMAKELRAIKRKVGMK